MKSRINLFSLVCLAVLAFIGLAPQLCVSAEQSPSAEITVPPFPYIAEITSDDVNIRSGPGTNYYRCGKLSKSDKVTIVGSKFSWSQIVPPQGSFSWVSMQFVTIDKDNPGLGTVTGDNVRVYAGSDFREPMHSSTVLLTLNKGDKVKLLGEQKDDYYKIAPPPDSYLWLLTEYTKAIGPVSQVAAPAAQPVITKTQTPVKTGTQTKTEPKAQTPATKTPASQTPVTQTPAPKTPVTQTPATQTTTAVIPTTISVEAENLNHYQDLKKQIEAERAKPMDQQDYSNIKKALADIANNKEAGKAVRYAEFTLKQIDRYELAIKATGELQLQNTQLQQIQERIGKTRDAKLAETPDLGKFVIIGLLKTSNIYRRGAEPIRYRITDNAGRNLCYALPTSSAAAADFQKLIGQKVGLVGTIEPCPEISGSLVRFTQITQLP